MDIFAIRLQKLLNENKLTKYRLAKDFNCSKSTVTNWCEGITDPKAEEIAKLAIYFDVSADYLLGLENEDGTKMTKAVHISDSFNNFNNSGTIKF